MIIIYDFDGTLTPYPIPKYKVLEDCGYDEIRLKLKLKEIMNEKNMNLYQAFVECIFEILKDNNLPQDLDTICVGANEVGFNKGVIDFFKNLQTKKVTHYILTSGLDEYVKRTPIKPYIKNIYGTSMSQDKLKRLITDEDKPIYIKKIMELEHSNGTNIVYIGDGLTDKYAFEYVKSVGGICIYLSGEGKNDKNYQQLNDLGIITECFKPNYEIDKPLYKYISNLIEKINN